MRNKWDQEFLKEDIASGWYTSYKDNDIGDVHSYLFRRRQCILPFQFSSDQMIHEYSDNNLFEDLSKDEHILLAFEGRKSQLSTKLSISISSHFMFPHALLFLLHFFILGVILFSLCCSYTISINYLAWIIVYLIYCIE